MKQLQATAAPLSSRNSPCSSLSLSLSLCVSLPVSTSLTLKITSTYPFLSQQETKSPFYADAQITVGLCVGMKVQGHTRWLELKIPYKNENLLGIFVLDSPRLLSGIDSSQWKSLINGSSMPVVSRKQFSFTVILRVE